MRKIELIMKPDLSAKNTDDEIHTDTSTWSTADKKKVTAYD